MKIIKCYIISIYFISSCIYLSIISIPNLNCAFINEFNITRKIIFFKYAYFIIK